MPESSSARSLHPSALKGKFALNNNDNCLMVNFWIPISKQKKIFLTINEQ